MMNRTAAVSAVLRGARWLGAGSRLGDRRAHGAYGRPARASASLRAADIGIADGFARAARRSPRRLPVPVPARSAVLARATRRGSCTPAPGVDGRIVITPARVWPAAL